MVKAKKPPARMNQARRDGVSFMPDLPLVARPSAAPDNAPGLMLRELQHGLGACPAQSRPLATGACRFMLCRKVISEET